MRQLETATLLFTDLVGSTTLLDRLGDEAAEELRRTHFHLLRQAVASEAGREVKNLGDGLMVTFNSAVHAVRAAVAIQQAIDRHNRRTGSAFLEVRIGTDCGEVFREDDDCFGRPVVVAQRLCAAASGGQILTTSVVRDLVGSHGADAFQPSGSLTLKGLTSPVQAYEVLWQREAAAPVPFPAALEGGGDPAFVGRDPELAMLRRHWVEAVAGARQLVLVTGEPGIGKTRLAAEFCREIYHEGGTVLYGACDEDQVVPYQPFAQALRPYVANLPADAVRSVDTAELGRLFPELRRSLAASGYDAQTERYRLFEAIAWLVLDAARETPVALVLDDLHWVDRTTLLILGHLLRVSPDARLLILGTYRETELGANHPLIGLVATLDRKESVRQVRLSGLGLDDVTALVVAGTGGTATSDLTTGIHSETAGNPLFVRELLRHLAESGATSLAGLREGGLPDRVAQVVVQRLGRLLDPARQALTLAAVVGQRFTLDVLLRVLDLSPEDLIAALENAADGRVIVESPGTPGSYAFTHALVRNTIYQRLSLTRRAWLHGRVGEALEGMHQADFDAHLPEIAHHYLSGLPTTERTRTLDLAERAADVLVARVAYAEAASLCARAIGEVPKGDDVRCCQLLLRQADALWRAGDMDEARVAFGDAAQLARTAHLPHELARAVLGSVKVGFGGVMFPAAGDVDEDRVALLEEALVHLPAGAAMLRARLLSRLAQELYWDSETQTRRHHMVEEAIALARQSGDTATLAEVLEDANGALWRPDDADQRLARAREILTLAETLGSGEIAARARLWLFITHLDRGEIVKAEAQIAALEKLSRELNLAGLEWWIPTLKICCGLLRGRLDGVEEMAGQTLSLGQAAGMSNALPIFGAQMFAVHLERGRLADMEPVIAGFVAEYPESPAWRAALAIARLEKGKLDDARADFALVAKGGFASIPRDCLWLTTMMLLALVCGGLGDSEAAKQLHTLLEPFEETVAVVPPGVYCLGSVALALGILAATAGRPDDAVRHFNKALEVNERLAAQTWLQRTREEMTRARPPLGRHVPRFTSSPR